MQPPLSKTTMEPLVSGLSARLWHPSDGDPNTRSPAQLTRFLLSLGPDLICNVIRTICDTQPLYLSSFKLEVARGKAEATA